MTPINDGQQQQAFTILKRSVCLTLRCHYLGNDRKVDLGTVVEAAAPERETQALAVDDEQVRATIKLIDPKRLTPVMRHFGRAKGLLRGLSIPGHRIFGERTYLVPNANAREASDGLKRIKAELAVDAAALGAVYAEAMNEQEKKLGDKLFDRQNYLKPEQIAGQFGLDWSWVSFAAPDNLSTIDAALADEAHDAHLVKMSTAWDEARQTVRLAGLEVAKGLVERLTPKSDGTRRALRETALDDLFEYMKRFPALDMTDDAELASVMATLKAAADGTTIDLLTDKASRDAERAKLLASAQQAVAAFEVIAVADRGISFAGVGA